ncbi:MAG: uracil-DNA glycosylase [Desulfobacterales bacterium]|jgi:DNA polymerase
MTLESRHPDSPATRVDSLLTEVGRSLRQLAVLGLRGFDCGPEALAAIEGWNRSRLSPAPDTLARIRTDLGDCRRCPLAVERNRIVFGEGDEGARLVFVGEAPGFHEDQQGRPFVGAAGQLLTRIIEAMQLSREKVYICNILKCRPPGNRNPLPPEIRACEPFLKRQLGAIRPEVIVALGKFAAQTLLATEAPISALRGRFHEYQGIKVMPTFHPAFLLHNPDRKRDVWEDLKQVMTLLGLSADD